MARGAALIGLGTGAILVQDVHDSYERPSTKGTLMAVQAVPDHHVVHRHRSRLLNWLAPFDDPGDQLLDGPDNRRFVARLFDADMRRSEDANQLWSSYRDEHRTYAEVSTCWQFTQPGLGISVFTQRPNTQWQGHWQLLFTVGPWSISFMVITPKIGMRRALH